jgi:hypothetical protein
VLSALSYHEEQPAAGVLIIGVGFEVTREFVDPSGQESDLYLGAACVLLMNPELLEHLFLVVVFHSGVIFISRGYFRGRDKKWQGEVG